MKMAMLITGGCIPARFQLDALNWPDGFIAAADSGCDNARQLGLRPDLLIGDFDSIKQIPDSGYVPETIRLPADKDYTDTELAARELVRRGYRKYLLVGGGEGRIDHTVALFDLFSGPYAPAVWISRQEIIYRIERDFTLHHPPGTTVSIFTPLSVPSEVSTRGLFWELDHMKISRGSSSISNRFRNEKAEFSVVEGPMVLISVPHRVPNNRDF